VTAPGPEDSERRRAREKVASVAHPLRLAIASSLRLRPQTAAELAARLDIPAESVRHYLRRMYEAGLVEREKERVGGRIQYVYSVDVRAHLLRPDDLANVPRKLIDEAEARLLRLMYRETTAALEAGTFEDRPDHALVRFVVPVDDRAMEEIEKLQEGLLDTVVRMSQAADERLDAAGVDPILACVQIFRFRIATEPWADPTVTEAMPEPSGRPSHRGSRLERLIATADPIKGKLLEALAVAAGGVAELSERIDEPPDKIRYQLRRLEEFGMVRRHSDRPRRGVLERVYIGESRNQIASRDDVAAYEGRRLGLWARTIVSKIFRDALGAMRAGAFGADGNTALVRFPMRLDEEGFVEVSTAIERSLEVLLEVREEALERIEATEWPPRAVCTAFLLFEMAPDPPAG
jgi:predicted transcriptional regulator